jgi:hypothetical protein
MAIIGRTRRPERTRTPERTGRAPAGGRRQPRQPRLGTGAAVMLLALGAYVTLHTPLRTGIAHLLGFSSRGCYLCAQSVSGSDAAHAAVAAVLVVLAACAAAVTASHFDGPRYERPLIWGVAVTGFITVPAATVGGLASLTSGTFLRPPAGPLLAAIPALAVTAVAVRGGWRPRIPRLRAAPRATDLVWVIASCAAVVLGGSVLVSLLHPPTQGDALSYHAPIGVFMWSYGNLTTMLDRAPEVWAFSHPGTAELFYGVLRLLGGEGLADLGQLPFALLGAAAAYAFTRRTGLGTRAAALAGCAFIVTPMVALQVGTQANDVAASACLMTAIALAAAPIATWRADRAAALGVALGLTAATKLALLPGVAIVGVIVLAALAHRPERRMRALVWLGLSFLVVVSPWWIRDIVRHGNPIYPQAIPLLGHGMNVGALGAFDFEYVPRPSAWPLYPILEPIDERSGYGALFAVAVLPGLVACWLRGRRWPLLLLLAGFVGTLPLWWKYTLHEPRFLLPYVGLGAALVPWSLVAVPRRSRRLAASALAGAAVFSVVLSFDQAILPLARQPVDRAEFYDRIWAVDPAVESLPEREAMLQVTGYGNGRVDYAGTYPLLGPTQHRRLVPLDSSVIHGSRGVVLRRMRATGVRYAYVTAVGVTRSDVRHLFAAPAFRLVHSSTVAEAERIGARRRRFSPASGAVVPSTIYRYLFALT